MDRKTDHLRALTGLRFVAAFAVFLHHLGGMLGVERMRLPLGNAAVSFFFVLSGFILTFVYAKRLTDRRRICRFYATRVARIWPLHVVVLLVFMFTLGNWGQTFGNLQSIGNFFANLFLLQSWIPTREFGFGFNAVSWSISTEMFFYAMFPLLLIGGQRKFWIKYGAIFVLTTLILVVTQWLSNQSPDRPWVDFAFIPHVNPLIRLFDFATGMAIGHVFLCQRDLLNRRRRTYWIDSITEFAAIGILIAFYLPILQFNLFQHAARSPYLGDVISTWLRVSSPVACFAIIIFVFAHTRGVLGKWLSSPGMVYLGEISFAFYMIHQIVIVCLNQALGPHYGLSPWVLGTVAAVVSVALSGLLYALVEMPAKKMLLNFYEWNWRKGINSLIEDFVQFAVSPSSVMIVVPLVLALVFVNESRTSAPFSNLASQSSQLANQFAPAIHFGDEAILYGMECRVDPAGVRMLLHLEKKKEQTRNLFIHICGPNKKMIRHAKFSRKEFRDQPSAQAWTYEVLLPHEQLDGAQSLGIGFHDRHAGAAPISGGPRSMNNRRLDVFFSTRPSTIANGIERDRQRR